MDMVYLGAEDSKIPSDLFHAQKKQTSHKHQTSDQALYAFCSPQFLRVQGQMIRYYTFPFKKEVNSIIVADGTMLNIRAVLKVKEVMLVSSLC